MPDDPVALGLQAERLMKDEAMIAAFDGVRQGLVVQLEEAGMKDRELQHEIVLSLQILKAVNHLLHKFIANGKFEKDKDSKLQQWRNKLRRA
jgi:hypothetical protein